jgi:hypothetical protein
VGLLVVVVAADHVAVELLAHLLGSQQVQPESTTPGLAILFLLLVLLGRSLYHKTLILLNNQVIIT